jgi:hypothetical protein
MIYVLVEEEDRLCMVLVKDFNADRRLDDGRGFSQRLQHVVGLQSYSSKKFGGGGRTLGEDDSMLPFLFWRVSIGRRRSPPLGAAEVSRGEPG